MATIYHLPTPIHTVVETTVLYYLQAFAQCLDCTGAHMTLKLHGTVGLRHIDGVLADPRIALDGDSVIMDNRGLVQPLLDVLQKPLMCREAPDPDLQTVYQIQIQTLVEANNTKEVRHA